ncbi:MAG: hypothetical protein LC749_03520 [Actinobacteria bacterium]|nr:hypothetical protein [Actinomycetota bacterium]
MGTRVAGVNVNLAPVADVLTPALGNANAAIGRYDRASGTDPQVVSDHCWRSPSQRCGWRCWVATISALEELPLQRCAFSPRGGA